MQQLLRSPWKTFIVGFDRWQVLKWGSICVLSSRVVRTKISVGWKTDTTAVSYLYMWICASWFWYHLMLQYYNDCFVLFLLTSKKKIHWKNDQDTVLVWWNNVLQQEVYWFKSCGWWDVSLWSLFGFNPSIVASFHSPETCMFGKQKMLNSPWLNNLLLRHC